MRFDEAFMQLLEKKQNVRRKNWGENTYLVGPEARFETIQEGHYLDKHLPIGSKVEYPPVITLRTAIGSEKVDVQYVPTQVDMTSIDWFVYREIISSDQPIYVSTHEIINK